MGLRFHLGRRLLLGGQTQLPGRIRQGHRTLRMDASPRIRPLSADGALLGVRFRNYRRWFLRTHDVALSYVLVETVTNR